MKNFIMKNRNKVMIVLAIIILVSITSVFIIANLPKEVAIEKKENEEIKASAETVPSGYIGIYDANGLRNMANNLSGNYILMADINMSGESFAPIGTYNNPFKGTFDGNNYTISNLTINSNIGHVGMFGYVQGGIIQNIVLENVDITSTSSTATGGIVGLLNGGKINNVEVNGNIMGKINYNSSVGGIAGCGTTGIITNTRNVTTVKVISTESGRGSVGGIIGNTSGAITNVVNEGTIIGENINCIGGIVGRTTANITSAYSIGKIETKGSNNLAIGGIAGATFEEPVIQRCYAGNDIVINNASFMMAGGLIGDLEGSLYGPSGQTYSKNGTVQNSYSTSSITVNGNRQLGSYEGIGGLIGRIYYSGAKVNNCYAIGKIDINNSSSQIGGLIGGSGGKCTTTNSYYSPKLTKCETSVGGTAKSTQELLYQDAYVGWDFNNIWAIEPEGGSLAYLREFGLPEEVTRNEVDFETRVGLTRKGTDGAILTDGRYQVKNNVGEVVREGGTNSKGIFWMKDLEVGTYTVEEIVTPAGYVKDSTVYPFKITETGKAVDIETNQEITLQIQTEPLAIEIQSRDDETDIGLQGITIGLYNEDGTPVLKADGTVATAVTNEEGKAKFVRVKEGTYKYNQTTTKLGYRQNYTQYTAIVTKDGNTTYIEENAGIIYNQKIRANVTITIKDGETDEVLQGAVIGIYDENKNEIIGEDGNPVRKITNEKGQVTFEKLEPGIYYYEEIEAPDGYDRDENKYKFVINGDGTVTFYGQEGESIGEGTNVTINNTVRNGVVIIRKRHVYGKRVYPVKGAVIGLYNLSGQKIIDNNGNHVKKTTDSNGNAVFYGLQEGTYQYREILAPIGYKINNNMYKFRISEGGKVTYLENNGIIYDEYATYGITIGNTIQNLDKIGITIYPIGGGQNIEKTIIKGGSINIGGLPVGGYEYRIEGDDNTYGFTINGDGSIDHVGGNGIFIGSNIIRKDVIIETERDEGTKIYLYDKEGNAIYNENGDHVITIIDREGNGIFSNLGEGEYKYKIEGDDNIYGFKITENGEIIYTNENGKVIVNLTITKYRTGTTIPLEGATIGIYNNDGTTLLKQGITNKNGQVTFKRIQEGNYKYKEIEAPRGYILNNTIYDVTIDNNARIKFWQNSNGVIYNDRIKSANIVIGTGIPGVTIGIYDKEGNVILGQGGDPIRGTTGEKGEVILEGVEPGDYIYKVEEVPIGYKPDNTDHSFNIDEDGNIIYPEGEESAKIELEKIVISITARKEWADTEAQKVHRPENVKIVVKEGETVVGEQIITTEEDKEIIFNNLAKYDATGNEIRYTIEEREINEGDLRFYVSSIEGNTITNTFTLPEDTLNVKVTKVWEDANNINGKRPESIVIKLLKEEQEVARQLVKGDRIADTWEYTFTRLVKYDENGNEIEYTIDEETVNPNDLLFYTKSIDQETKTITNTYIVNIGIRKVCKNTQIGLQGAVIVLIDELGVETEGITNKDGYVIFGNLEKGKTYTYKEKAAPLGYILNEETYTFTVNEDGTITYGENGGIIENEKITANVEITKYEEGTTIPVEGAIIGLFDKDGNAIIGQNGEQIKARTNALGKISILKLGIGTYKYKELEAPLGYILNDTMYTIIVNSDGSIDYGENEGIIYNKKIPVDPVDPPEDPDKPPVDPEDPVNPPKDPNKPPVTPPENNPNKPNTPQEPTNVPAKPVKPNISNNYTGVLPKTGETLIVLIIAVIIFLGVVIMLTYNYIKIKKEKK